MKELTYTRCGDYDIPDLELSCREDRPIGKYGRMRKRYLQDHRPVLFNCLLLSEPSTPIFGKSMKRHTIGWISSCPSS